MNLLSTRHVSRQASRCARSGARLGAAFSGADERTARPVRAAARFESTRVRVRVVSRRSAATRLGKQLIAAAIAGHWLQRHFLGTTGYLITPLGAVDPRRPCAAPSSRAVALFLFRGCRSSFSPVPTCTARIRAALAGAPHPPYPPYRTQVKTLTDPSQSESRPRRARTPARRGFRATSPTI